MGQSSTLVNVYRVHYRCDNCDMANMKVKKAIDGSETFSGHKRLYYCPKCGHNQFLKGKFPRTEYMRQGASPDWRERDLYL